MTDAETQQRSADQLRRKCWLHLQSINAAGTNEPLHELAQAPPKIAGSMAMDCS